MAERPPQRMAGRMPPPGPGEDARARADARDVIDSPGASCGEMGSWPGSLTR